MNNTTKLEKIKQQLINLSTEEQIIISETLLDELYTTSETFGWTKHDFLTDRINKVVYELALYIANLKNTNKREEMQTLLKNLETFPENKKRRVITAALSEIRRILKEEKQKQNEIFCAEHGHDFGNELDGWTCRRWESRERVFIEQGYFQDDCIVKHFQYSRTCARCGYHEDYKRDKTPEIVLNEEERKERQQRIKELEEELSKLKCTPKKKERCK